MSVICIFPDSLKHSSEKHLLLEWFCHLLSLMVLRVFSWSDLTVSVKVKDSTSSTRSLTQTIPYTVVHYGSLKEKHQMTFFFFLTSSYVVLGGIWERSRIWEKLVCVFWNAYALVRALKTVSCFSLCMCSLCCKMWRYPLFNSVSCTFSKD